jgi:hypothetical protein
MRTATLLVPVRGVSGRTYPAGTTVAISGAGAVVDGFVGGDWMPLSWWEFGEGEPIGPPPADREPRDGVDHTPIG